MVAGKLWCALVGRPWHDDPASCSTVIEFRESHCTIHTLRVNVVTCRSMHDEANPTFVDMLDNTHVGQRAIVDNFGVSALPNVT